MNSRIKGNKNGHEYIKIYLNTKMTYKSIGISKSSSSSRPPKLIRVVWYVFNVIMVSSRLILHRVIRNFIRKNLKKTNYVKNWTNFIQNLFSKSQQ